jgi:hypothetical protein
MRDEEPMQKLCGEDFREQLLACAKRYWNVSLNDAGADQAQWLLLADRDNGALAFEVLIPLAKNQVGLHTLRLTRWQTEEAKAEKKDGLKPVVIPVYYLPGDAQN